MLTEKEKGAEGSKKQLESIDILGLEYAITYVDNPADADLYKRSSVWGQIDYWTRTIRIYQKNRGERDVFETLLHEILHGIVDRLKLKSLAKEENHDELDLLAIGITDILYANNLLVCNVE